MKLVLAFFLILLEAHQTWSVNFGRPVWLKSLPQKALQPNLMLKSWGLTESQLGLMTRGALWPNG